jgi:hypothetical protein
VTERPGRESQPPQVFVSYSDDSPTHAKRVLELAQWLRSHGVDAHIDQFEDSPEEGWPRWIVRQIREAEFVLVIATPHYLALCEGEEARTSGGDSLVRFKSHLSLQELHESGGRNRKFIPVLYEGDAIVESVPLPLRGATCYRLPTQLDDLYRRLTGQPKVRRAPLGVLKTFDDESLLESTDEYTLEQIRARARERAQKSRASLDEQRAEDSLRAIVDAGLNRDDDPPPRRERPSWFRVNRQNLVGVSAFGLAFLAVGALFGQKLFETEPDPTCRIQLTDPNGSIVEGIDRVELELPSGHRLDVAIKDGNVLQFACPPSATQAQAHVFLRPPSAPMAETMSDAAQADDPDGREALAVRIDGRIELPSRHDAGPQLQRARLVEVRRQSPETSMTSAQVPKPEPEPEPEPELPNELALPDETSDHVGLNAGQRPGHGGPAKLRTPQITATIANQALAAEFTRNQPALRRCYETALTDKPGLGGALDLEFEIAASGQISAAVTRNRLQPADGTLTECIRRNVRTWKLEPQGQKASVKVNKTRATLEFAPTDETPRSAD